MSLGLLPLVLAVGLGMACSSSSKEASKATQTAPAKTAPAAETETAATLRVDVTEWSITGENGGPIPSVTAGELTFEVHNIGQIPHELVVIKTDTDPANLPLTDGDADETGSIGEVEQFPAGQTETGSFNLQPGTYALICNIPAHYKQGMHALLTVE
jgi:uncharacterized cupredoxin-like copper-binding protein